MFSSLTIALLALASAALAQNAQPDFTTLTRVGRQGEVRFVNRVAPSAQSWMITQAGNSSLLFTSATFAVNGTLGSAPATVVTSSVASLTASDFIKVDTGLGRLLQVTVVSTLNTSLPICQFTVGAGSRTTVVIRATLTAGSVIPHSGTCTFTDGTASTSCSNNGVANNAKIEFQCSTVSDSLGTSRDCNNQPVRFYNFLTESCDKRLKRTDVIPPTGTSIFLNDELPSGVTSANSPVTFNRQQKFAFKTTDLPLDSDSRFTDVILTDSAIDVKKFKTGFLNLVNVAFRLTGTAPTLARNNTFTLVIAEGQATTISAVNVVHIDTAFTPLKVSGWIEVRADVSYTAFLYPADTTEVQIFGDNAVAMPTAGTATAITTVVLQAGMAVLTLAVNEMRIVRVTSSAESVAGTGNAVPAISTVPLGGNNLPVGTKFVTWNQLFDRSISLVATTDTSCTVAATTINHNRVFIQSTTTSVGPFSIFNSAAKCNALGSPLTATPLTALAHSGASCKVQGLFVVGHTVARNVTQTCIESGPCNVGVTGVSKITGTDNSDGIDFVTIPAVTMCSCTAAPPAVCEDVCEADKFNDVLNSIEATRAAVLSASSSSNSLQGTIRTQLTAVQGTVNTMNTKIRKMDKTLRDVEDDVSDLVKGKKN
jgi:hypothetical protein